VVIIRVLSLLPPKSLEIKPGLGLRSLLIKARISLLILHLVFGKKVLNTISSV